VASTPLPGLRAGLQPPASNATDVEVTALQPYPDAWLNQASHRMSHMAMGDNGDPAARYEERESVQLAFLTVLQLLPGRQRAVLLLRDVLAFSSPETAQILDASDASVNSALQRARAALDSRHATGRLRDVAPSPESLTERGLLEEFIAAWHRRDIPALVSMLATDALLTMPPQPLAYRGGEAISLFLSTVPAGGDLTAIRLVPTRANGQPAVAAYLREGATALAYGVRVLTIAKDKIGEITGFAEPTLFPVFDLATRTDW
jgi:RNA polymerase sigma-70 factor (ECF subfamily)